MRLVNGLALVATQYNPFDSAAFSFGSFNAPRIEAIHTFTTNTHLLNNHNFASIPNRNQVSPRRFIKIPNPFASDEKSDFNYELKLPRPPSYPSTAGGNLSPDAIFAKAKTIVDADLGLRYESLLADDFIHIGPNFSQNVLGKEEYLAAGNFFDLRATFPDLDYRAHDFRLDPNDSLTVRATARVVGTMRGPLRLRKETIPPNGKRMVCPPETISMTFDAKSGKLVKLCAGFTMDRLVGNTNGFCGVMAAASIAGKPPSEWDIFPPLNVVQRFFGRTVKQLPDENSSFLAPFPETVMIQLAKGVIAADNGASDPDLLGSSFTFCGPIVGPIGKDGFVKAFGGFNLKEGLPDLDAEYSNFRVDPYDPYRVWVDARGSGTRTGVLAGAEPTGLRYEGPPEAASFTFDDDGFCVRLTAGVAMDPSQGNTGGLGGVYGIFYATGTPLPGIISRALPDILSRVQKRIVYPITNVDVDDISLPNKKELGNIKSLVTQPSAPTASKSASFTPPSKAPPKVTQKKVIKNVTVAEKKLPPQAITKPKQEPKAYSSLINKKIVTKEAVDVFGPIFSIGKTKYTAGVDQKKIKGTNKKKTVAAADTRKEENNSNTKASKERSEAAIQAKKDKVSSEAEAKKEKIATIALAKKEQAEVVIMAKKKKYEAAMQAKKDKFASDAEAKKEKIAMMALAKKEQAEVEIMAKKEKAEYAMQTKKDKVASVVKEKIAMMALAKEKQAEIVMVAQREKAKSAMQAKKDKVAVEVKTKKAKIATLAKKKEEKEDTKRKAKENLKQPKPSQSKVKAVAPKAVPTLSKWRRGRGKSITGNVSGAQGFDDGEQITTSEIASGELKSGNVVITQSGSRYFLD